MEINPITLDQVTDAQCAYLQERRETGGEIVVEQIFDDGTIKVVSTFHGSGKWAGEYVHHVTPDGLATRQ